MPAHDSSGSKPMPVDAAVQAQVALRLIAGLVDSLVQARVLAPGEAALIAETAARRAEVGPHSRRVEIAEALRKIVGD